MADLQNFVVTQGGSVNVNVQQFTIACQVFDLGVLVADFTGANALVWPNALATLTAAQRRAILDKVVNDIIYYKAGLQ